MKIMANLSQVVYFCLFFSFLLVLERAHDYGYEFHEIGIFFCDPVQLDFNPKNQNFFSFLGYETCDVVDLSCIQI